MCDTTRRCDRSSCPCNEPDTELKDALTRMQERFPASDNWNVAVEYDDFSEQCEARANTSLSIGVGLCGYGPTPHAAVDAAIKAWDAAVKADALTKVLKAECEACRRAHGPHTVANTVIARLERDAARAATDKAGALR